MQGIFAGIMISIGCVAYLMHPNVLGAFLFSIGLITIVLLDFNLFTGKAGLYSQGKITLLELGQMWVENLIGVSTTALVIMLFPQALDLAESAQKIVETANGNPLISNLALGVACGFLMNLAVTLIKKEHTLFVLIMPVMTFILCGYRHCVADMFYVVLGMTSLKQCLILIPITVGNFIGCNIFGWLAPEVLE